MNKIFLVEDDVYGSRMYERAFRFHGYEVEIVSSGKEAWERLLKMDLKPNVIITDVTLPEMSGRDLIQNIKQNNVLRSIPIVVLTNSFAKEDADEFLALGADLYLVKIEYDTKVIVEKVHDLIQKHERSS